MLLAMPAWLANFSHPMWTMDYTSTDKLLRTMAGQVAEMYEAVPRMTAAIVGLEVKSSELERRVIQLESGAFLPPHRRTLTSVHDVPNVLDHYDPDKTPAGAFRVAPEMWQAIQTKFAEQEAEKRGAEKALKTEEHKAEQLRKQVVFYLAIATAIGGAVGFLLSHFGH